MKTVRRFGFILWVLFIGIIIGYFGFLTAVLVFCPLMMLWFMLWDEKKFKQAERRRDHRMVPPSDYYHYEG